MILFVRKPRFTVKRVLLLCALAIFAAVVWLSGVLALSLHLMMLWLYPAPPDQPSLGLADYHVVIDAHQVTGIDDNLSGLTFDEASGTLFGVTNRPQEVIELSRDGQILRRIPIRDTGDIEDITHIQDDWFALTDEGSGKIIWVQIRPETTAIETRDAPFFRLDPLSFRNMGFEGVSWDHRTKTMYLSNEMWPVRVLKIDGLDSIISGKPLRLSVAQWSPDLALGHSMADLSSVSVNDTNGNILLLSHMTGALAEFDAHGTALGMMLLWRGQHGLAHGISQAEGIAIDAAKTIYIVGEPNLFYRFEK